MVINNGRTDRGTSDNGHGQARLTKLLIGFMFKDINQIHVLRFKSDSCFKI